MNKIDALKLEQLQGLVREALGSLPAHLKSEGQKRMRVAGVRDSVIKKWCAENPHATRVIVGTMATLMAMQETPGAAGRIIT